MTQTGRGAMALIALVAASGVFAASADAATISFDGSALRIEGDATASEIVSVRRLPDEVIVDPLVPLRRNVFQIVTAGRDPVVPAGGSRLLGCVADETPDQPWDVICRFPRVESISVSLGSAADFFGHMSGVPSEPIPPTVVDAGAGSDIVRALHGPLTARGGAGPDLLHGGPFDDRLEGGDGEDDLLPGAGADEVFGGANPTGLGDTVEYRQCGADIVSVTFDDQPNDGLPGEGDNVHSDVEGYRLDTWCH